MLRLSLNSIIKIKAYRYLIFFQNNAFLYRQNICSHLAPARLKKKYNLIGKKKETYWNAFEKLLGEMVKYKLIILVPYIGFTRWDIIFKLYLSPVQCVYLTIRSIGTKTIIETNFTLFNWVKLKVMLNINVYICFTIKVIF